VKKWTQDYREFLEENLIRGNEKKKDSDKLLEDYTEHHTDKTVHFELVLSAAGVAYGGKNLDKAFKLRSSISLQNMMLFDSSGTIQKYDTAMQIIEAFAATRLDLYDKRKAWLLSKLTRECDVLSAKARFIKLVIEGQLKIKRRKIKELANDLRKFGFKPHDDIKDPGEEKAGEDEDEDKKEEDVEMGAENEEGEEDQEQDLARSNAKDVKDFEYLVGMPIATLTAEKIEELMNQVQKKKSELEILKKKSLQKMWTEELDELEKALDERDEQIERDIQAEIAQLSKAKKARGASKGRGAKRGAPAASEPARATKRRN